VLFVVEAERGRKEAVAAGIAKLEWAGLQVLGTVLNKRRKYVPSALYRAL
jgi:Mrp family chromosome partitioning ATPase